MKDYEKSGAKDETKFLPYYSLKVLLTRQLWSEFDAQMAVTKLPDALRQSLLTLKAELWDAESRQRELTRFDQLRKLVDQRERARFDQVRKLIDQRQWAEFDAQVAVMELPEELLRRLLELKAEGIDKEKRECEQARFDQVRKMIDQRQWAEFDEQWICQRDCAKGCWTLKLRRLGPSAGSLSWFGLINW